MTYYGDQVEQVKERTDLVRLFERYTKVQRSGADFVARCCFHDERSPSLTIYADGRFHCFGCGAHGDAVTLLREKEHLTFQQAVEQLARDAGITLENKGRAEDPEQVKAEHRLLAAVAFAADFYAGHLGKTPIADDYLASRGFEGPTLQRHRVGWAEGGQTLLQAARAAGHADADLLAADLVVQHDGRLRDRFYRRITVPILDKRGRPVAFTARAMPDDIAQAKASGRPVGKWINSRETAIYRKGATVFNLGRATSAAKAWSSVATRRRLLVCEGALDVLALDQAGHAEACAPCGTAITADQAQAITEAAAGRVEVFLVLDGDAAGEKGADRGVRELLKAGAACRVAQLPEGLDPAELLIEQPTDDHRQAWQDVLATAKPAVPWLTDRLCPADQRIDEAARLRAFDDLVEILQDVPDEELRELYLEGVSKTLKLRAPMAKARAARRWAEAQQAARSAPGPSLSDTPGQALPGARGSQIDLRYPLNEQGNALRFADRYGLDSRYVHTWGVWIVWQGTHWEIDRTKEIERRMLDAIDQTCRDEISALEERLATTVVAVMQERIKDAIDDLDKWRTKNANDRAIVNSINRAAALANLGIESDQLDADPWAFTVQNGTLDLRTGELQEHRRDHWITRLCDVRYDPTAWSGRWASFIEDFAAEDAELVAYIKRAVGYACTGITKEDAVWMWSGPGGNGKGTLVAAVQRMLGTYARSLPFEIFLITNSDKRKWSLAETSQCRLVTCEESEEGKRFNASLVKLVSGGTPIEAERKHGQPFTYLPRFKTWFITNNLPTVSDTDRGFWRRLHSVRCEHLPPQVDRDLREHFQADPEARQAILAWAVEGARDYAAQGLNPPKAVLDANKAYREDQDPLKDFLAEACVIDLDDDGAALAVRDFRAGYRKWCDENGVRHPLSDRAVAQRLTDRGVEAGGGCYIRLRFDNGTTKSVRGYRGIRWRTESDERQTAPRLDDPSGATSGATAGDDLEPIVILDDTPAHGPESAPLDPSAPLAPRLRNPSGATVTGSPDSDLPNHAPQSRLPLAHAHEGEPLSPPPLSRRERNPDPSEAASPPRPGSRADRFERPPDDDEDLFSRPHRPDGTRTPDPDPDDPESPTPQEPTP